jgi:hypothetical protein
MAFDPLDYDEVYETTSAPEKTTLLRQGWVLLDERFDTVGGLADEPLAKSVARTALSYQGGQGFWSGAAQQQPGPDPPRTETTYVLGWPKGQETISEDEFERSGSEAGDPGHRVRPPRRRRLRGHRVRPPRRCRLRGLGCACDAGVPA